MPSVANRVRPLLLTIWLVFLLIIHCRTVDLPSPENVLNISTATPYNLSTWAPVTAWTPEEYPNPQIDLQRCGREGVKSFVCDPNRVITHSEANTLDSKILDIQQNTPCTCEDSCETQFKGYKVSIAIIPGVVMPEGVANDGEESNRQVGHFADFLRENTWSFGECGNDIVIVLSVNDKKIFTSGGADAAAIITRRCIYKAFYHARKEFSDGQYFAGLMSTLKDYEKYLKEGYCPGIEGPSVAGIVLGSLFASIVVICVLFCIFECVKRRRASERRRKKFNNFSTGLGVSSISAPLSSPTRRGYPNSGISTEYGPPLRSSLASHIPFSNRHGHAHEDSKNLLNVQADSNGQHSRQSSSDSRSWKLGKSNDDVGKISDS